MQLTVGLVCVAIGTALILFAALWNPGSPPVEVVQTIELRFLTFSNPWPPTCEFAGWTHVL